MRITKDTTDEEILAAVMLDRAMIVKRIEAGDDASAESLGRMVNSLAAEEGRAYVRAALRNALAFEDATAESIEASLIRLVMNGPDDTYSGRGNDVRRARFDGLRDEVRSLTEYRGIEKIMQGRG